MPNYVAHEGNDSDIVRIALEVRDVDPVWKEFPDINQAVANCLTLIFNEVKTYDEREEKLIDAIKKTQAFRTIRTRPAVAFRGNVGPQV